MKFIGIDYGTKRVGVAVTDEAGLMAFPKMTLPNNKDLLRAVVAFAREEKANAFVVGESKNMHGKDNAIMQGARAFAEALEKETHLSVHFEPEFYTSVEARRLAEGARHVDAEAASIILNSFILKNNDHTT